MQKWNESHNWSSMKPRMTKLFVFWQSMYQKEIPDEDTGESRSALVIKGNYQKQDLLSRPVIKYPKKTEINQENRLEIVKGKGLLHGSWVTIQTGSITKCDEGVKEVQCVPRSLVLKSCSSNALNIIARPWRRRDNKVPGKRIVHLAWNGYRH